MVDSHLPRFSQGIQAVALALAFALDARWVVPLFLAILLAAVLGGPRTNLFAYLYRSLPVPRGELEAAAPHRFSQALGTAFLGIGSLGLYALEAETTAWWVLGWGPALLVAVLSALAASTALCVGCEMYLFFQRLRARTS